MNWESLIKNPFEFARALLKMELDVGNARSRLLALENLPWVSYTPELTAATSNPDIGNGVLSGEYCTRGNLCVCNWSIIFGTLTTPGSGVYYVSLPIPSVDYMAIGTWRGNNAAVKNYCGVTNLVSLTTLQMNVNDGTYVTDSAPWTPGDGDSYRGTITYRIG